MCEKCKHEAGVAVAQLVERGMDAEIVYYITKVFEHFAEKHVTVIFATGKGMDSMPNPETDLAVVVGDVETCGALCSVVLGNIIRDSNPVQLANITRGVGTAFGIGTKACFSRLGVDFKLIKPTSPFLKETLKLVPDSLNESFWYAVNQE